MPTTLALDFGSRFIGVALVDHPEPRQNRVLYAATLVVEAKPLNALAENRAAVRRLRRTRKSHRSRLRRLAQVLSGIPNGDALVRFCRRRGFSHSEAEDTDPTTRSFQFHRSAFFQALREEVCRLVPPEAQERAVLACSRHLNEACRREAELRPARFLNRRPSRCQWEGCGRNVPQADNAIAERLRQALTAWLLPVFAESPDKERLRRSLEHWVGQLDGLARGRRKVTDEADIKRVQKGVKGVYRLLLGRVSREASAEVAEKFKEDWKRTYRAAVGEILKGGQGGRVRYCREHSRQFAEHLLAGKVVPNRTDIAEADLVSRKQQIVFRRIWRLVQSRLLPLAGGRIDRVVVERVAFDVLAGPLKARQQLSPEKAAEMYRQGPMLGFPDRMAMLREEFGGRCAYCGRAGAVEQVEHLLPRSAFPFDSYFNILPACASCNARKGPRTALDAGLTVHEDAYNAYGDYVRRRVPPHAYHTVKKGLLNLLRRPGTAAEAERRLAMLANDLVTVTASQRSPRPLARYLATRLEEQTRHRPEVAYQAGRHTALYRSVALPGFDKSESKEAGDLRNHAVDAILLACDFPPATALENTNWRLGFGAIQGWFEAVRRAAPQAVEGLGLPRVESCVSVPYFEDDLGGGYFRIDLAAFNWNRKRKATHMLDPYGQTRSGLPLKRVPAAKVLEELRDARKREARAALVAHPALKKLLQEDLVRAPERLVRWLQRSVRAGLARGSLGNLPADRAREGLLRRFVEASPEQVVAGEEAIPPTIGIRCVNLGSQNKLEVVRADAEGTVVQHYQADPVVREMHVGYSERAGGLDRERPVVFIVTQQYKVWRRAGGVRIELDRPEGSALRGRAHGSREPLRDFLVRWTEEFSRLVGDEGLVEVHRISQGCVIEKDDGTRFQFRNFDRTSEWMKAGSFRGICRVYRSPLQVTGNAVLNPPEPDAPAP